MDISRPFRSRDELLDLIIWVCDTPGLREAHWLEWKSQVDLTSKERQALVAKFVLGTSNRPRRIWEQAAGGYAYLLLGVGDGQTHNTVLPDPAQFDKVVNQYLGTGADRPGWTATEIPVGDGTRVVAVTVDPPEPGRRPHVAKGSLTQVGLMDGRTYIRRDSETTEASSAEVEEMLRERDAHIKAIGPAWALRLEVVESSLIVVDVSAPTVQQWLDEERAALVGSMLPRDNPLNAILSSSFDGRTREEFHQQVDEYLEEASNRVETEILWQLVNAGVSELQIVAHNDGDDNLLDLEVELLLPKDADAAGRRDDVSWNERLPERPRPFGSGAFGSEALLRGFSINPPVRSGITVRTTDGGVSVRLPKVEVRPRNSTELQPMSILLPRLDGRTELQVEWRATARDMRGVAQGTFSVPIEGEAMLAKILSRPTEEDETSG
jgi:hypothetical protein